MPASESLEWRGGARLLFAWVAATSIVLATGAARGGVPLTLVQMHLALLVACAYVARGAGSQRVATLLPLIAFPILYAELPFVIAAAGRGFQDAAVQRWELALFGASPVATLPLAFARALGPRVQLFASEALHASYLAFYAIVYVPVLLLLARGRDEDAARTAEGITATFIAGFVLFAWMPVAGPRYLWSASAAIPPGPVRAVTLFILERGSSRGTAFPSSHVALAVAQGVFVMRYARRAGLAILAIAALLALGAVYGGFHYGVDAIAGATLGATVSVAMRARWQRLDAASAGQPVRATAPRVAVLP